MISEKSGQEVIFKFTGKYSGTYENGVVLVLALLLLFTMTIIGVSTMSRVFMQERMAGNANLQALAFEAASAGISEALDFTFETDGGSVSLRAGKPCAAGDDWIWPDVPEGRSFDAVGDGVIRGSNVTYTLQVICREDQDLNIDEDWERPAQLFVRSRGEVTSNGEFLAAREVEVRVETRFADGGLPASAIHIQSDGDFTFGFPNSGQFLLDGKDGFAITASDEGHFGQIESSANANNFNGEYKGGIGHQSYPEPWGDAELFATIVRNVKIALTDSDSTQVQDCLADATYHANGLQARGNDAFSGVNYVAGDFGWDQRGNPSGSGLLIVEGDIGWRGGATFDGLIISIGGSFDVRGGGNGASTGSMILANVDLDDPSFDDVSLNFSGGAMNFTYECNTVNQHAEMLACLAGWLDADELKFACEGDDVPAGGADIVFGVRSWREDLGWGL